MSLSYCNNVIVHNSSKFVQKVFRSKWRFIRSIPWSHRQISGRQPSGRAGSPCTICNGSYESNWVCLIRRSKIIVFQALISNGCYHFQAPLYLNVPIECRWALSWNLFLRTCGWCPLPFLWNMFICMYVCLYTEIDPEKNSCYSTMSAAALFPDCREMEICVNQYKNLMCWH
jgi:hypothetical protein